MVSEACEQACGASLTNAGQIARKQRRRQLLAGKKCFISGPTAEEHKRLCRLAEEMGAEVLSSVSNPALTHVIGNGATKRLQENIAEGDRTFVSSEWLEDTYTAMSVQPEAAYVNAIQAQDENTPPVKQAQGNSVAHLKLATEMHEIRKRLNTAPVRRNSRKILGRVKSITALPEQSESVMIDTNESEGADARDITVGSQGVVYSDPEAAEARRQLFAKIGRQLVEEESGRRINQIGSERATSTRVSMRAVGLGESTTRSLRPSTVRRS